MRFRGSLYLAGLMTLILSACSNPTAAPTQLITSIPVTEQLPTEILPSIVSATLPSTSLPTQQSTATPEPSPLPSPLPLEEGSGLSRSAPYPAFAIVPVPNWEVQVLDVLKADQAWQALQSADEFNPPAPDGNEYLLLNLKVKNTSSENDARSINGCDFDVTGDRMIRHTCDKTVTLSSPLDANLTTGQETEGQVAYLVGEGETNLILIFDEKLDTTLENERYIAIDNGASISVSPELGQIEATEEGVDPVQPAALGEAVSTQDWEVSVVEVVRGDPATELVQQANQFNNPPSEGKEFLAVRVRVRHIGTEDRSQALDTTAFGAIGLAGTLYDPPGVVPPAPVMSASFFPGGVYEGWIVIESRKDEAGMALIFQPPGDDSGSETRYLSLESP